jgi:hypothetical protein
MAIPVAVNAATTAPPISPFRPPNFLDKLETEAPIPAKDFFIFALDLFTLSVDRFKALRKGERSASSLTLRVSIVVAISQDTFPLSLAIHLYLEALAFHLNENQKILSDQKQARRY